jgi:hypothetical protein
MPSRIRCAVAAVRSALFGCLNHVRPHSMGKERAALLSFRPPSRTSPTPMSVPFLHIPVPPLSYIRLHPIHARASLSHPSRSPSATRHSHLSRNEDSATCRAVCVTHNLEPMIPKRGTKDVYRGRYVIEQTFGILDQFRRIRVRYDTLIRNFKSFHYLAMATIVINR